MYDELGGFAESPEVVDGNWKAYNFCLAENYLQAMGEEDWDALGHMDTDLVNDIARWLNYDGEIGKNRIDIIKNIPKGLIQTSKNRTFVDAIVAEHKATLAQTFIYNGNHDVRLYLTAIIYGELNVVETDTNLLNHIYDSFECNNVEDYSKFISRVFEGIEQHYLDINDIKEQQKFLKQIKEFIKVIRIPAGYQEKKELIEIVKLERFNWQKSLKKLTQKI